MISQIQLLGAVCTFCGKYGPGVQYDYSKWAFNNYNNAYSKRVQTAAEKLALDIGWVMFPKKTKGASGINNNTHSCPTCFDTFESRMKTKKKAEKVAENKPVEPVSINEQPV